MQSRNNNDEVMRSFKLIIKLVFLLLLAIGSSVGLFFYLKEEFKGFETPYGLWESFVCLFQAFILLLSIFNLIIYAIVAASWYGVYQTYLELFEIKEDSSNVNYDSYKSPYMGAEDYDPYEDKTWERMEDKYIDDYGYDDGYYDSNYDD